MILLIELLILLIFFTLMVYIMSLNPIKTLYNYPPKIQEKVRSLKEYQSQVPTIKNMIMVKMIVSIVIVIIISLIMKYINEYNTFTDSFKYSLILWSIINIYDVVVLDIIWFCHSKKFIFKGTEDIIFEYKNYWFHIKEGLIGEILGIILCFIVGIIVKFIL